MPKNKGKGGKNYRRGKNENDNEKRELQLKEEDQEYALVLKMLGNGRLESQDIHGVKRLAHIRGKMRKKVWISQGDYVLLSLREYQDEKCDVIHKYKPEEVELLMKIGQIPTKTKQEMQQGKDEDFVHFGAAAEDEEDDTLGPISVDEI
ncbi:nucleic acid-binding protein [Coemansia reversa NRRL 1564]|uniref:Nucleic acid-binding protein n=1 Tax=Coemansia reversa (strain ATCC 12441 / NRRL 1564) TaxID=763665 RepID=A0A2G5BDP4_COERN|nr:nucleic acid-binding protein [Coemansia reversa NRRL 1564]|eukprot:PIA17136.1 nucleic acid-binding protein [Coemansia reversa NRRL 1564]